MKFILVLRQTRDGYLQHTERLKTQLLQPQELKRKIHAVFLPACSAGSIFSMPLVTVLQSRVAMRSCQNWLSGEAAGWDSNL